MFQRVSETPTIRQFGSTRPKGLQGEPIGIDSRQQSMQDEGFVRVTIVLHGELAIFQQLVSLRREALRSGDSTRISGTRIVVGHQERAAASHQPDLWQRVPSTT